MADDMEQAAVAFDTAIAGEKGNPPPPVRNEKGEFTKPTERMFENIGEVEVDDESPPKGGGDEEDDIYGDEVPEEEAGEAEEGDEEGEEEDEKEPPELSKEFSVMIDGEEKKVPLKEALEGYIRTETFHKRMSELDESNKIVRNAANDVVQQFEYAKQLCDLMEVQMKEMVPDEPNWDEMFKTDPARARNLQKYYEQVRAFKGQLQQQRQQVIEAQNKHNAQQLKAYADAEELRFVRINSKNWGTDPKRKMKDLQSMRRTALTEGFTDKEIDNVFDSRMLMVLLKASKYDRMMAAKPKPVVGSTKQQVKSGSGNSRTDQRGLNTAMKKLSKTGSLQDAAPVFDQLMRRSR